MTHPLQSLFDPRRVAVVGAAQDPHQVRGRLLHNLKISGFRGEIFPIHPKHAEIQGLRAWPGIAATGTPIDLAIVAVPWESLLDVLRDCGEAGVKGAVVVSGIPAGDVGEQLQSEMSRIASRTGLRILGPNCLGFFRPFGRIAATFSPLEERQFVGGTPSGKRVAVISQSGGTGLQLYEQCSTAGLNVVQVMMPGNEADLDVVELLDYAVDSGEVDLVLMYIEGISNGPGFMRAAARAADADIPILALKIGKTAAGSRSAISHTAHLTGSDAVYEAVFERYGITRVYDPDAMIALATVMARGLRMRGNRVGIVSSGGGHAGIAADLCEVNGLTVPPLGAELRAHIASFIPSHGSSDNPLDTAGTLDDHGMKFCRGIQALVASDEVDAVIGIAHFGLPGVSGAMRPYLEAFSRSTVKPILLTTTADLPPENAATLRELGIRLLTLADGTQALKALARYSALVRTRKPAPDIGNAAARRTPRSERVPASRDAQRALLAEHGVPLPGEAVARTEQQACDAARSLGYPLALKIESPDIPHKTEAGGVRLGVRTEAEVREGFRAIMADARAHAPQARLDGVLLQQMVPPGREVIVGTVTDDTFGPQIMVGLGGIHAEILKDVVVSPAPIDLDIARDMIGRLRGAAILRGARGEAPADLEALARLLVDVAALAVDHPSITQLDLNPVVVQAEGQGLCVVDTLFVCEKASP